MYMYNVCIKVFLCFFENYCLVSFCDFEYMLVLFIFSVMYMYGIVSFLQGPRNLSQLPNFAFSVPLAMFHCSASDQQQGKDGKERSREADHRLQDALMKFPCVSVCGISDGPGNVIPIQ